MCWLPNFATDDWILKFKQMLAADLLSEKQTIVQVQASSYIIYNV